MLNLKGLLMGALLMAGAAHAKDIRNMKNKPMPPFVMTTLGGQKLTNHSFKGKVVLFDFWATWCGPCKMASPVMEKLAKNYAKRGLVVIGADTLETTPGPVGAKKYKAEHKYTYTFTYDNDGLSKSLEIDSIPAFAVMDKKGIVRFAFMGVPPNVDDLYKLLASRLEPLLKG